MATPASLPHLIDLAEWDAMDEQEGRVELVEGVPHQVITPLPRHNRVAFVLMKALDAALPSEWCVAHELQVLIEDGRTPTIRVPDVVVARTAVVEQRRQQAPADVLAVVEVLSPGTRRVDRMHKLAEYAEVGIAHYLLVEPDAPVTATELQLVEGAYRTLGEHRGHARLDLGVPGGVEVDLDALDR